MGNRFFLFAILLALTSTECIFHGVCKRTFEGTIINDTGDSSFYQDKKVILLYDDGIDIDTLLLSNSGKYSKHMGMDQADCKNDCYDERNTGLPKSIKVSLHDDIAKQAIFDTTFYCESYQFSGDDIILPDIVLDSLP